MKVQVMQLKQLTMLMIAISIFASQSSAQQLGINEDGSLPNSSAILDVKSATKGVLLPRLSSTTRMAIPNTKGLLVYDTTTNSYWYNNGTAWQNMAIPPSNGWLLSGNTGTDSNSFLGTTDSKPLRFKVADYPSGIIDFQKRNVYLGFYIGSFNHPDSAEDNTAFGHEALHYNIKGTGNTAVGSFSLTWNRGNVNTAVGYKSLMRNTNGVANTAVGMEAMRDNFGGYYNTAMGALSLSSINEGFRNTSIGAYSLSANVNGTYNTATGAFALAYNGYGTYNTANGASALGSSESSYNTATGAYTLIYSKGNSNTATGYTSLYNNWEGFANVGDGSGALYGNLSGNSNTGTGYNALYTNTIGNRNTAVGASALAYSQTGDNNTAVGYYSHATFYAGTNNTSIGAYSAVVSSGYNATALGYNAYSSASNKVRIGNTAVTRIEGQVPFTIPSDGRYKFGVKEDVSGLDFIMQLRPVTYQFDVKTFDQKMRGNPTDSVSMALTNQMNDSYKEAATIRHSGFIAQEVEKAANSTGYDFSGVIKPTSANDHYSLSYETFVVPLVKAVQELHKTVEQLQKKIDQLERANATVAK